MTDEIIRMGMELEDVVELVKDGGGDKYFIQKEMPDYAIYLFWKEYSVGIASLVERFILTMDEYEEWSKILHKEQEDVPKMSIAEATIWAGNFTAITNATTKLKLSMAIKISDHTDRLIEKLSNFKIYTAAEKDNNLDELLNTDFINLIPLYKEASKRGWSIQDSLLTIKKKKEDS